MTDIENNQSSPVPPAPPIRNVEFKAAMLLILLVTLVTATVVYLMYARGAFESTQRLVLIADDAEGVVIGMDVTFAGFPIGRVSRIELNNEGKAKLIVDVPRKDAHWLRTSSIFTMERGLVGATKLRAFSGVLSDPPLPEGSVRPVLIGDAAAAIPLLLSSVRELVQNLNTLTAAESSLDVSLRNVKSVTDKLAGKSGALGVITGSDDNAKKLIETIDKANKLLATVDGLAMKADTQVFGKNGAMPEAKAAIVKINGLLTDANASLKKIDAVLTDAQAISANVKGATSNLGPLRADVDTNLRKVEQLVNEINRKWPFKREAEVKLP